MCYNNDYITVGNGSVKSYLNYGSSSWSGTSDERYKKNIEDATAGLSFINDLRPITYQWKTLGQIPETSNSYQEGSTEQYRNDKINHGFVAQEVKEVIDNHPEIKDGFSMWNEGEDGEQTLAEGSLIPMLVKSIQELSAKCDSLQSEINILKGE